MCYNSHNCFKSLQSESSSWSRDCSRNAGGSESAIQTAAPVLERPRPLIAMSARGGRVPVWHIGRPSREHCFRSVMTISVASRSRLSTGVYIPTAAAAAAYGTMSIFFANTVRVDHSSRPHRFGPFLVRIVHYFAYFDIRCLVRPMAADRSRNVLLLFSERFRNAFRQAVSRRWSGNATSVLVT